jgi:hypothetical protein
MVGGATHTTSTADEFTAWTVTLTGGGAAKGQRSKMDNHGVNNSLDKAYLHHKKWQKQFQAAQFHSDSAVLVEWCSW